MISFEKIVLAIALIAASVYMTYAAINQPSSNTHREEMARLEKAVTGRLIFDDQTKQFVEVEK